MYFSNTFQRYPQARPSLCAGLTDGRTGTDPGITKGDDERVLNKFLKQLEEMVTSNVAS